MLSRCPECDRAISASDSVTAKTLVLVNVHFCDESCRDAYRDRSARDLSATETIKEMISDAIEKTREEVKISERTLVEAEYEELHKEPYRDGYNKGYTDGFRASKICERCHKHVSESVHHILPREYGGKDHIENFAFLCFSCHDYVELETDKLFKQGKKYSTEVLRAFIHADFPQDKKEIEDPGWVT